MLTIKAAEAIAKNYLNNLQREIGTPLQLTKTQDESFGWVFFYQAKEYMETGVLSSMLAGNAPFVVNRETGQVDVLGTAHPADVYINEYSKLHTKSLANDN